MVNDAWAFSEQHFSTARLRHYLAAAGGDVGIAQKLYDWNASLSGAFWVSLGHFEVSLRNALDARLSSRHERLDRSGHWIFDDARELGRDRFGRGMHAQPYKDIAAAIGRVVSNRKPVDPGQVLSEVSFGFWHQMVSKRQTALWPDIAGGFPHAPSRARPLVHDPVKRLRDLRNRIGHHHRIWALDVGRRFDDLCDVAGYIDPRLQTWIVDRSEVRRVLASRPRLP